MSSAVCLSEGTLFGHGYCSICSLVGFRPLDYVRSFVVAHLSFVICTYDAVARCFPKFRHAVVFDVN